ncbi:hypothetical protein Hgul01_00475 [Herpetosiphon gulosus]|uniref:Uncharacterized protein n=1 Tax=Herpetosiphon gulosus TaxID=1973496 RepID=A0ABP9WU12_9CHLR
MYNVPSAQQSNVALRIVLSLLAGVLVSATLFTFLREPVLGVSPQYLIMPRLDTVRQRMFVYAVYGVGSLIACAVYSKKLSVSIVNSVISYSVVLLFIEGYRPEAWELVPRGYVQRYAELMLLSWLVHLCWNAIGRFIRTPWQES